MDYKQCRLSQDDKNVVAWIEIRGAKPGAKVEVKDLGGFWQVDQVFNFRVNREELREKQKNQRNFGGSIK